MEPLLLFHYRFHIEARRRSRAKGERAKKKRRGGRREDGANAREKGDCPRGIGGETKIPFPVTAQEPTLNEWN